MENYRRFIALSPDRIAAKINTSSDFVAYIAPGITKVVAVALSDVRRRIAERHQSENVAVILDSSAETCRLGYGDISGIEHLEEHGFIIRNAPGLRIGLLVCDNNAWILSSTPLLLEEGSNDDHCPNALEISTEEAKNILRALQITLPATENLNEDQGLSNSEIGQSITSHQKLKEIKEDLKANPPQKFDIARKVRVFNSYLEYVDLQLSNCNIQRHTFELPKKLIGIVKDEEMKKRIRTTVKLISDNSKISGKQIEDKVRNLRKLYIKSLGQTLGNVIMRSKKDLFNVEIIKVRKEIDDFKEAVRKNLEKEINNTINRLTKLYTPLVRKNPPPDLFAQISNEKPTKEQAAAYIQNELKNITPSVENLIQGMSLECHFKGVTYETLQEKQFLKAVKEAFPYEKWDLPFDEYDAAPEAD